MKKVCLIVLSLLLCLNLCACSNNRESLAKEYMEAVIENDWETVEEQFYFWEFLKGVKNTDLAKTDLDDYAVSIVSEEEDSSLVDAYALSVNKLVDENATLETVYVVTLQLEYKLDNIEKTCTTTVTIGVIDGCNYVVDYGFYNLKL